VRLTRHGVALLALVPIADLDRLCREDRLQRQKRRAETADEEAA
jgi:hypothetical protein